MIAFLYIYITKYIWMFFLQVKDKTKSVLQGLLQDLGAELRDERIELDSEANAALGRAAEVRTALTLRACVSSCCV